ncbi:phospho-N-acetylmuramoyl-pentapeptide-transferase [Candidatus Saccharibacteria bacterium]|nr:phospho-N-acetylmuramoyl-pentapeptide-transferase [Candidatus Saccharibacteria bacterium]
MVEELIHNMSEPLLKMFLLAVGAFVLAMILTPIYTFFAYKYKFWKVQKTVTLDGKKLEVFSKLHEKKISRHVPTMAGLVFVIAISVITLAFNWERPQTWLPLAALIMGAGIGLIDDIMNLRSHGGVAGLRAPVKFALITLGGLVLGWFFYSKLGFSSTHIPFVGEWDMGVWIIPMFAFVVVATGNAVNITDGLDGLAGGLATFAFGIFGVIALLQGNFGIAAFCFTILGALLAYLWFNIFPARFFMGDVGSFALGSSLAVVAMLTGTLFLLPIIGLIFVVDTGSVIIQQLSKKLRNGKKIWLTSPIHHHFEAVGWPEAKVTMRFWLLGAVAGVVGLILALAGGNIR